MDARHGGDRFATRDEAGNLVVWDAASLEVLFEAADASHFAISSGVLIYDTFAHDAVYVVDATTGTPTGELPHQFASGIARDGGYVWTGSPTALRVYESDGSERWSVAGDFSDVAVLAMPDTLHAHASLESASEVLHYASADGTVDSDTFLGTFEGWFDDVPRYWTNQGMAYRVYDVDNSVLLLDLGYPSHGWDRWLGFGGWSVLDVLDPDTVVPIVGAGGSYRRDGAGILTRADDGSVTVTRLDTDPIETQLVDPSCCVDEPEWSFAFSGGSWIIGGEHGRVHDHLDRAVTNGELLAIAGSIGGRIAISPDDGIVQIADVGDDCSFAPISSFPRTGRGMRMSGDGTRLLSIERWEEGLTSIRDGVRFYDLPAGTLLEGTQVSLTSETIVDIRVSDDASIWSRIWSNGPFSNYTGYLPLGAGGLLTDNGNIPTSIAPDSSHIVASDGSINQGATWSDSATYIYDPDDFVAVLDGVCHGFVDGDHVLVARYDDCGTDCLSLIGSELVAMDGTIVLATTLPDIRDLTRVADGEVLGVDHATGDTAIYDVYAGTMLWEAPPGAEVEVAGPDHVLVSTGARVALVRWR
ncbi:MAG: hypothetical protein IAG13_36125 [Deltaproteobacteria bacterium]|nr:hypothetical protein [Nannocystaceae bacterium]